uniref:DUF4477 domain-containing protein n=1 Tax=Caenorhabditis japonica TaxID=281687 RepID=A0A8R1DFK3_CAEJA
MTESYNENEDAELIEMLDDCSNEAPANFFEHHTTKESTTIEQLREPISLEAESVAKWLIYKQSGPHRHQKFFAHFRQMSRLLKKYNDPGLVKKLNTVLRKMDNCGDHLYKLDASAIRYMGSAYVKRVFLLEKIRASCVKCSSAALGMLELAQWVNLCLVLVAICAQVHVEVVNQIVQMEKAYKTGAKLVRNVDKRFPESLDDLTVAKRLKRESGAFDDRKVDISAVGRLMKYSEVKMEQAQMENEMVMRRNEVLTEMLSSELSLDSAAPRPSQSHIPAPLDLSDLGISICREDLSFLNNSTQPDDMAEDLLMSPDLFSTKSDRKLKIVKKKKSFLASTMSLLDDAPTKKKKKVKK